MLRFRGRKTQPKDTFDEPPQWEEDIAGVLMRQCVRAWVTAEELGKEPLVLVSQDIWELILGDSLLRTLMRWQTESVTLWGVKIVVAGEGVVLYS